MASNMTDKVTVQEGLVQIVEVERFQAKPRSGGNTHVVVMERSGATLRHYCTLRSDQDKLSIGEQLWGKYVCYVVTLGQREMRIEQDFLTSNQLDNVHVIADVVYAAVDGERVVLGVEDALRTLREDLVALLRREIRRLTMDQVVEEQLEAKLNAASTSLQSRLGVAIERARVRIEWDDNELARRRAAREEARRQQAEDAQRRRSQQLEDENRRRVETLEIEDVQHIDQLLQQLGLSTMPADVRVRLLALPRQEALQQVIAMIEEQRAFTREVWGRRMQEEYDLLRKLIDTGVLEDIDLVDFGRGLLNRYQHMLTMESAVGIPPELVMGGPARPRLQAPEASSSQLPEPSTKELPHKPETAEDTGAGESPKE